jgi:opacity protein-like surface antigen
MRTASNWIAGLTAITLCALVLPVQAPEAAAGDSYLLLKAGAYGPRASDVKDDLDTGFAGEVAIGHYFLPFLGVELAGGYMESSKDRFDLTVYPVTLAAKGRLPIPVVKPYGIVGGGAYFSEAEVSGQDSRNDTAFGYFAGAGVDFKVLFLLINIEAKYLWVEPSFDGSKTSIDGIVGTVGVGFEF